MGQRSVRKIAAVVAVARDKRPRAVDHSCSGPDRSRNACLNRILGPVSDRTRIVPCPAGQVGGVVSVGDGGDGRPRRSQGCHAGVPQGQPTDGRDEYTDNTAAAAGGTDTAERGSAGTGGVTATPRRTTAAPPGTTVETGRNGTGLTDEQILADLHATGDGTSPGIRALKRTYAIGQTRAARIHQQITDQEAEQNRSNDSQKNAEPSTKQNDDEDPAAQSQESEQEYPRIRDQESHPGITDRVGRPRSTKEWAPKMPDADSPVASAPNSESTAGGRLAGER